MELNLEVREPIVEKCVGCSRVKTLIVRGEEGIFCGCYLFPKTKWRVGDCPRADHLEKEKEKKVPYARRKFGKKHK